MTETHINYVLQLLSIFLSQSFLKSSETTSAHMQGKPEGSGGLHTWEPPLNSGGEDSVDA